MERFPFRDSGRAGMRNTKERTHPLEKKLTLPRPKQQQQQHQLAQYRHRQRPPADCDLWRAGPMGRSPLPALDVTWLEAITWCRDVTEARCCGGGWHAAGTVTHSACVRFVRQARSWILVYCIFSARTCSLSVAGSLSRLGHRSHFLLRFLGFGTRASFLTALTLHQMLARWCEGS